MEASQPHKNILSWVISAKFNKGFSFLNKSKQIDNLKYIYNNPKTHMKILKMNSVIVWAFSNGTYSENR